MEHMSYGHSVQSFCGKYYLTMGIVKTWAKNFPEFSEAMEIGRNLQRYQWEKILLEQAQGQNKANPAAMIFALKNFFPEDFQDKREVAVTATQIVVDTGIGHRDNNQIIEGEVVEKADIEGPLEFDDLEEEERPGPKFTQNIEDMFDSPENTTEEDLDFL